MNTLCVLYFTYVAFYSERNGRKRIVVVAHDSGLTRHRSLKIRAGLRPLFASYKKPSRVNSVQSQLGGQREEDSRDWKENEEERHLPISWTFKTLLVITKFTPPLHLHPLPLHWSHWGQVAGICRRLHSFWLTPDFFRHLCHCLSKSTRSDRIWNHPNNDVA